MAASMSLAVEFAVFAHRVPFLAERHYMKWPAMEDPSSKVSDKWDTLGLLIEQHNDGTRRKILRAEHFDYVRVESFYNSGNWAQDYDFLVAPGVVDGLLAEHCIEGTPHMGYTDDKELHLTQRGMEALAAYIQKLD